METSQLSCIHLLRTVSHGILSSRTLNVLKPALLRSRAVALLFGLLPPVSILGQFFLLSVRQKDLSMSHGDGPFMAQRVVKSSETSSAHKSCDTRPQCSIHIHPVMDHCYALQFSLSHSFSPPPNLVCEIHPANF